MVITISFASLNKMKREAVMMEKEGLSKFMKNYNELVQFLKYLEKRGLAEKDLKKKVVKVYANKSPVYSFAYLATVLENHFCRFSWSYQ